MAFGLQFQSTFWRKSWLPRMASTVIIANAVFIIPNFAHCMRNLLFVRFSINCSFKIVGKITEQCSEGKCRTILASLPIKRRKHTYLVIYIYIYIYIAYYLKQMSSPGDMRVFGVKYLIFIKSYNKL